MSAHDLLVTAETALIYSTIGGLVAWIFSRRPLRTLLRHQSQIADQLDTTTDGGITDLIHAIDNAGPPPSAPTRRRT